MAARAPLPAPRTPHPQCADRRRARRRSAGRARAHTQQRASATRSSLTFQACDEDTRGGIYGTMYINSYNALLPTRGPANSLVPTLCVADPPTLHKYRFPTRVAHGTVFGTETDRAAPETQKSARHVYTRAEPRGGSSSSAAAIALLPQIHMHPLTAIHCMKTVGALRRPIWNHLLCQRPSLGPSVPHHHTHTVWHASR